MGLAAERHPAALLEDISTGCREASYFRVQDVPKLILEDFVVFNEILRIVIGLATQIIFPESSS